MIGAMSAKVGFGLEMVLSFVFSLQELNAEKDSISKE
jgi:hypothetical protein